MAFEKKQSKNVKKFHYLERLWPFVNGDGRKGPLKDDRRWVLCGGVGVVVLCKLDERGETRPRSDVMWTSEACELINASWKPDASTVSICSLYTIEKRFSTGRESCPFWFRSREFAAKREFRSLFRAVRIGFGGYGRTFFHFSLFLFYFQLRMDRFRPPR